VKTLSNFKSLCYGIVSASPLKVDTKTYKTIKKAEGVQKEILYMREVRGRTIRTIYKNLGGDSSEIHSKSKMCHRLIQTKKLFGNLFSVTHRFAEYENEYAQLSNFYKFEGVIYSVY
jgi:hypothetical protein